MTQAAVAIAWAVLAATSGHRRHGPVGVGVLLIIIIAGVTYYFLRRRRTRQHEHEQR